MLRFIPSLLCSLHWTALDPRQEVVESLMQTFKDNFRTGTVAEISRLQHATSTSRRPYSRSRGRSLPPPLLHSAAPRAYGGQTWQLHIC